MRRRRIAQIVLLALIAGLAVLAPAPAIVQAEEAVVESETVELAPVAPDEPEATPPPALAEEVHDHTHDDEAGATADHDVTPEGDERQRGGAEAEPFDALGVTVDRPPADPMLVRGLVGGRWTEWFPLVFNPDEGPDPSSDEAAPGHHSQLVWLGGATEYEIDAPDGVGEVEVHLIRREVVSRTVELREATASAASPGIRSRSEWGARPPAQRPGTSLDLKLAIVHHSVNGNTYTAAQVPALIRSMQAYHIDVNGWDDLGYNFVVDRFGGIWEGRAGGIDKVVVGGHSAGFNTGTTGVVVIGDFTSAVPPAAALEAVSQVIAWKFAIHRVDPASTVPFTTNGSSKYPAGTTITLPRVVGHRDTQTTSCPGTQLYNRLSTIRSRVAALWPGFQSSGPLDVVRVRHDINGLTDTLQYRPGTGGDQWWRASGSGGITRQSTSVNGTYRAVSGDFDGNGYGDVLWHGTGSSGDSIWWGGPNGSVTSQAISVGGSYVPVVGDFDGNGTDDVLWYGTGPAPDSVWYFSTNRTFTSKSVSMPLITGRPLVGDFTGDGRDDILWYGPGPGADDHLWLSTGQAFTSKTITVNGYHEPVVIHRSGNQRDSVAWVPESGSGATRWDFSSNGTVTSRTLPAAPAGARPHAGDFDGDGDDDVLLYVPGPGADAVWWTESTTATTTAVAINNATFLVTTGRTAHNRAGDDILFIAPSGSDYLWSAKPDRTFTSTQVG